MDRIVEIILYQLKTGTGREFHRIMEEVSVPLHRNAGLEILAFGNSLDSEDAYVLIRAFDSLAQIAALQHNFYSSEEWVNGPRSDILGRIKSSAKSVLPLNESAIHKLKSGWGLGEKRPSATKTQLQTGLTNDRRQPTTRRDDAILRHTKRF